MGSHVSRGPIVHSMKKHGPPPCGMYSVGILSCVPMHRSVASGTRPNKNAPCTAPFRHSNSHAPRYKAGFPQASSRSGWSRTEIPVSGPAWVGRRSRPATKRSRDRIVPTALAMLSEVHPESRPTPRASAHEQTDNQTFISNNQAPNNPSTQSPLLSTIGLRRHDQHPIRPHKTRASATSHARLRTSAVDNTVDKKCLSDSLFG